MSLHTPPQGRGLGQSQEKGCSSTKAKPHPFGPHSQNRPKEKWHPVGPGTAALLLWRQQQLFNPACTGYFGALSIGCSCWSKGAKALSWGHGMWRVLQEPAHGRVPITPWSQHCTTRKGSSLSVTGVHRKDWDSPFQPQPAGNEEKTD